MLKKNPWEGYVKPGRIFGNLYFVGTRPASTHVIDTGEGLILIDPGYQDSLYLVIHNMWEVGLNPKDIKYILITHCHMDHMNATQAIVELTGARVFFPKLDMPLLTGEIFHYDFKPLTPDVLIEDGDVISLGNTHIKCVATPGHTDGTTSYFFEVSDGKNTYRAGMHGGVGTNSLAKDFLVKNNLPFDCRDKYLDSLKKVENEQVDIFIGNHVHNNNTIGKLQQVREGVENAFLDPGEWKRFLERCRMSLLKMIASENE